MCFADDPSSSGNRNIGCWEEEVRMVKDVPDQSHIVEVQLFGKLETLEERDIMSLQARSFENVDTAVTKCSRGWVSETRGVEPMLDGALVWRQVAVADAIRQITRALIATKCVGIGRI